VTEPVEIVTGQLADYLRGLLEALPKLALAIVIIALT